MSLPRNEKITCPQCGKEAVVRIWSSVNVTLDPEMKEHVLDGSLFDWTCPVCGYQARLGYSLLYHDMEHHFMLEFSAEDHPLLFRQQVYCIENGLNIHAILHMMDTHREQHHEEIIFDHIAEENGQKVLVYAVYEMTEQGPQATGREHRIPYSEYEAVAATAPAVKYETAESLLEKSIREGQNQAEEEETEEE